jgi:hypothetical protein
MKRKIKSKKQGAKQMQYVMDMSMEKEKSYDVFPEGLQKVEILTATVKKSKSGNDMLVATILCVSTGAINEFMFTMIKEKRWVLKSLLEATDQYYKNTDGYYVFDTDNLVGKIVIAQVINVEEEYTDRQMQQQKRMKSQIRRFMPINSINMEDKGTKFQNKNAKVSNGWNYEDLSSQPKDDVKVPF